MSATANKFDTWALVEIMGHQRAAGRVTEATIAGGVMLRIDIPKDFGRDHAMAWYYLGGFGIVHTLPANDRIVKWDSAA